MLSSINTFLKTVKGEKIQLYRYLNYLTIFKNVGNITALCKKLTTLW